MKNKVEITRKQLDVFGDLLSESEYLISKMIESDQAGPSAENAKQNKGLCKKYEGHYWWNDVLAVHKMTKKAAELYSVIHERLINEDA